MGWRKAFIREWPCWSHDLDFPVSTAVEKRILYLGYLPALLFDMLAWIDKNVWKLLIKSINLILSSYKREKKQSETKRNYWKFLEEKLFVSQYRVKLFVQASFIINKNSHFTTSLWKMGMVFDKVWLQHFFSEILHFAILCIFIDYWRGNRVFHFGDHTCFLF